MPCVLIIGAGSDIALALARKYAAAGYDLILTARSAEALERPAQDIRLRSPDRAVNCCEFDVLDYSSHSHFFDNLDDMPDGVVVAAGYSGKNAADSHDFDDAQRVIDTNFTGIVSLLNIVAARFEERRRGFIIGISSVAGDRGRKSNYLYGASKAALTTYLSGLRNRLHAANIQVLTVKPGFVATKMTAGMDLPRSLTAQPDKAADDIFRAQQRGASVIYTTWIWRWIMLIVRNIPERIFKRLNL